VVYLANGDFLQAEHSFLEILRGEQDPITIEIVYAKYGLAQVAKARGERDKAHHLALEAWNDLSRSVTSHRILNQIQDFLKSLEVNQDLM
jgi:hypothetical protein